MDFQTSLNVSLNVLSAAASIIVILMIIMITIYDRRLMDRVSLRFTLAISVVDLLKAILILVYIFVSVPGSGIECIIVAYLIPAFTLLYMFLTMCIALNLQLTFVSGLRFNSMWERWYWAVSIIGAFGIMAVPLAMDQLGFDKDAGFCFYKNSLSYRGQVFQWATYHSWIIFGCLYCTLIVILTIIHLGRKVTVINRICEPEFYTDEKGKRVNVNEKVQKNLKRLIRRISLYCLIPIVTQIGFIAAQLNNYYAKEPNMFLEYWSFVGTDLPGILNLMAFLLDPSLYAAYRAIRNIRSTQKASTQTLKEEEVQTYELKVPKRSTSLNKAPVSPAPPLFLEKDNINRNEISQVRATLSTISEVDVSLGDMVHDSTFDQSFQSNIMPISPNTIHSSTPLNQQDRWLHPNDVPNTSIDDITSELSEESHIFHDAASFITLDGFIKGL